MRKTVDGEIRNKDRTKEKLISAVGAILIEEGYVKLGINNIAKKALVDKKLIYRYFGGLEELISTYFRTRDFWSKLSDLIFDKVEIQIEDYGKEMITLSLVNLLDSLRKLEETRKIILWEISEKKQIHLEKLSYERELLRKDFFLKTDPFFINSDIDLRSCYSLLLGGVYYLSLHSQSTGGEFCGIDITKEGDLKKIKKSIKDIIELIYSVPSNQNKYL